MDQREELARLITGTVFNQAGQTMGSVWQPWTVATVADAILAAGWEKRSPAGEAGLREAVLREIGDFHYASEAEEIAAAVDRAFAAYAADRTEHEGETHGPA